jgi:DNA-binding NtrC family response regulator
LKNGSFREDLYYRLNVIRLELPPLRERHSDIPLLVDFFRKRQNTETGKNIKDIDEDVINTLMNYDYPGNVRELENIIQHAFVLCKNSTIKKNHLPKKLITYSSEKIEKNCLSLAELEKKAICEALLSTNGNHLKAAKQLGINPSTLYRKLKRYNIT